MFTILWFSSSSIILSGLIAGVVFGFLVRKGHLTRFDTIVGQFLFRDFTVMKVMFTAIIVGSIGLYSFQHLGFLEIAHISRTTILASLLGGGIFGIGMATLGYCPGTGIGALADGSPDMIFGLLGMITGVAAYAEIFPWISTTIKPNADLHTDTLTVTTGYSPWIFILAVAGMGIALFIAIEKWEKGQNTQ